MAWHVRTTNDSIKDRRFRSRVYENKRRPTLCGAEPTENDCPRDEGARFLTTWVPLRGHVSWVAEKEDTMCPACRTAVQS